MPGKSVGYRPGIPQQPYTKWDTAKDEVEVDYKQLTDGRRVSWFSGRKGVVLKILLIVVIFSLGLIIGYVLRRSVHEVYINPKKCAFSSGYGGYSPDISDLLQSYVNLTNLEENLRKYTSSVHLTGTSSNNNVREVLKEEFVKLNLTVREAVYKALLSYADWAKPNLVSLVEENGTVVYSTTYPGQNVHPELNDFYNAYAPNGTVEGDLVYANYGEMSDFEFLTQSNVSCKNKIVIMRYGLISRMSKVQNAATEGSIGVILYSDPADVLELYVGPEDVYPNGWWLPGEDAQRGSVRMSTGDPLTPGLPAKDGYYRLPESEAVMPKIPCQPIGYSQAQTIMSHMAGKMGTNGFHGALHHNVSYRIGPGFRGPKKNIRVRLEVYNERELRNVTNILGIIEGAAEPDRYVIVGCHYDAWTFGAVDPNSGTAVLTEIAKGFAQLKKKGWRPRRTVIFAHWDAEEQGLIGSTEWVEEHAKELAERTVAYINLDGVVRGNATFDIRCSPMLQGLFKNATKQFPSIVPLGEKGGTMYDSWLTTQSKENGDEDELFKNIDGSSDQAAFVFTLGVPSMFPRLIHDKHKMSVDVYPAYHASADHFLYMKKFVDPSFKAHETMAKMFGELVLQLASFTKIPLDVRELGKILSDEFNSLHSSSSKLSRRLDHLQWAIGNFSKKANEFHERMKDLDVENILLTRDYNDRLMGVSRAFIHGEGLPGRPSYKNILFAPSTFNSYQGAAFVGIYDAFRASEEKKDGGRTGILEKQISLATLAIESASHILQSDLTSSKS